MKIWKSPVLRPDETQLLLDKTDANKIARLRGRGLIRVMAFNLAQITTSATHPGQVALRHTCSQKEQLNEAQGIAYHENTRTTRLCIRTDDAGNLDEIERNRI